MSLNHLCLTSPLSYLPAKVDTLTVTTSETITSLPNAAILGTDQNGRIIQSSGSIFPPSYIQDLICSSDVTQAPQYHRINIGTGKCTDSKDSFDIFNNAPIVGDIKNNGVNGLDTGAFVTNTWYYIHIIADSTSVNIPAMVFSQSATAPTLPAGYDKFRRIGTTRSFTFGGVVQLIRFYQSGRFNQRTYYLNVINWAGHQVLGGSALIGAPGTLTWVPYCPPTSNEMGVTWSFTPNSNASYFAIAFTDEDDSGQMVIAPGTAVASTSGYLRVRCDSNQLSNYYVDNAGSSVNFQVQDYVEYLTN